MGYGVVVYFCICWLFLFPQSHGNRISKDYVDPSRVTTISWRPRAFLYKNFLKDEQCDHLISLARGKLEKSMVGADSTPSEERTSTGMFLRPRQDEVVSAIEDKIAAWTFLPVENGEGMQILHYEDGQKYDPHYDYFEDELSLRNGGHRIATVLMYLSHVGKGGETVFPRSEAGDTQPKGDDWSECARKGYAVKPMKGDALLFFSLHPNVTGDRDSLHGGCPVLEGEKWSATKWIHVRAFGSEGDDQLANEECVDENPNEYCPEWAAKGECVTNPEYMKLFCKKSCNFCS